MSIIWDILTCNITNNSSYALNVSNVPNLDHGKYGTYPESVTANSTKSPSFTAESKDLSEVAPRGSLTYGLADGTVLTINFDMQFPEGQTSTFTASLAGARAGSYGLTSSQSNSSYEGQGQRWTVNLVLNSTPGSTTTNESYKVPDV